jgi:hypothetical protein
MTNNILDLKLGSKRQLGKIIDIIEENAKTKDKEEFPKIVLVVDVHTWKKLKIDEMWVRDNKDNKLKTSGLWLKYDTDGKLSRRSALGSLMDFYGATTLRDLIGKPAEVYPKKNKFMAIVAIKDFNEEEI